MNFIETDRLILRRWEPQDLEPFATMCADPKVMEFFPNLLTKEETQMRMDKYNKHIDEHGFGRFACALKETNQFIGYVGLCIPDYQFPFSPCIEIGWGLASDYWGKGYITEGAYASLQHGFEDHDFHEIVAFTVPKNTKSIRVMERIGMKHEAQYDFQHPKLSKDHPLSLHVFYRITKEDFEKQQKNK